MDYDVTSFLTLGVNLSGTFSRYESPNSGSFEDYHPWLSPYDENGKLKKSISQWRKFAMYNVDLVNPLMDNRYNSSISRNDNLMGSFSGTLRPFDWMSFTSVNTYRGFIPIRIIIKIAELIPGITAIINSVTEYWISVMLEIIVS